ncbi:MAG: thioredoxin family protein [Candidatus Pacebacteria bacterium CG10_big_fil_rev_8_21_14_0_10_36_11]|nr:thioredoxin family protein [Candidatus Pacearchaeota archaeon]OIP73631.1 MAG: hypothetical protein AUK08_03630 [Candidatus Pacebacteria bacterium CG2_30_36_39]PIR64787.1 MAG: thioredoxin family protein [Candidatus Pacebacteria bacterium CG10_big_fil_rev_8_21_14_0_10_36_11]PJC43136.1 MAG: thioredoxin family protein [Candidatus Pacebacteria bacterium CG_4_9_14_0_2_um_filter_36_8]
MKIQVLGSGCPTCQKLHEVVLKAAKELNLEKQVEYLSGPEGVTKIVELGAMSSPVLAIDDQIVITGFNGDVEKIKSLISGKTKKAGSKYSDDCEYNQESLKVKICSCGENC